MVKLKRRFAFYIRPKKPYNFRLTVKKPADWEMFTPFEIYEKGVSWTALHIEGLLVGLKLRSTGNTERPNILIDVFLKDAPKSGQKIAIKNKLTYLLAAEEDISEFYRMAKKDSILKHAVKDLYGMHWTNFVNLFAASTLAISLQMAPTKRSEQMMACMIENYGDAAEFEGKKIRVWPLPKQISKLRPSQLARKCNLGYRAKYLVGVAKILQKEDFPTFKELEELSPEDAKEKLLELPGIGDYSADILNPHGGFPIDVWSVDIFAKLFHGKEPKNARKAIEKIKKEGIKRWGEWSWMAFFYVVHDLKNLSKKLGTELRLS